MAKTKTKAKTYTLKVTQEQADILSRACEWYSRWGMGQFAYAADILPFKDWRRRSIFRDELHKLEPLYTNLPPHANPGIAQADEQFRITFDLYQVIRHRLWWDKNPKGWDKGFPPIDSDTPLKVSEQELAKIEEVK